MKNHNSQENVDENCGAQEFMYDTYARVISMAKEPIIVPKRPHARTLRPRQWHIARGGPSVEKKFWKRG